MPRPPTRRSGALAGLILLACWLGWTASSFAALAERPAGDAAAVAALLQSLADSDLVLPEDRPVAVHFSAAACACEDARGSWSQAATAMRAAGGIAIEAPAASIESHGIELLLLDADGTAAYAGPLSLPPLLCGQADDALAQWLPELLSPDTPPLLLPSRCSC